MSSIEDQINESVHGYDDDDGDDEDVLTTEQEMIDQLTDRNCELCDEIEDVRLENADLLADIERLKGILREFLRWDEGVKGTYLTRMQIVKLAREALDIPMDQDGEVKCD